MSQAECTLNNVAPLFHPVSHYDSPDDVLNDARLSTPEKRLILSSWASDRYVVESHPTLRAIPGIPRRLPLEDILAALKRLDDDTDPPPRGGLAMRLANLSKIECTVRGASRCYRQARSDQASSIKAGSAKLSAVDQRGKCTEISQALEDTVDRT